MRTTWRASLVLALAAGIATLGVPAIGQPTGSGAESGTWRTSWAALPYPATVSAVDCTSATNCIAVGGVQGRDNIYSFVMRNKGGGWYMDRTLVLAGVDLFDAECTAPSNCMALGMVTGTAFDVLPIVQRWDGTRWTRHYLPSPSGPDPVPSPAIFTRIACGGGNNCMVVGEGPAAAHWDGRTWTVVPLPGLEKGGLTAAACLTDGSCWMTGTGFTSSSKQVVRSLTRWKAGKTTTVFLPGTTGPSAGIGCAGPSSCYAAFRDASPATSTVYRYSAGRWSRWLIKTRSLYHDITCSQAVCYGVGGLLAIDGTTTREVVGRFAGGARTTELPPTHHVAGATATELDDVSCVSARICMAVGVSWSETVPGRQFLLKRSG